MYQPHTPRLRLACIASVIALCPLAAQAQTTTTQDFDRAAGTPQYTYSGGTVAVASTYGVSGNGGGVNNSTQTLTFQNRTFTNPSLGGYITFRLAALGTSNQGMDETDYVLVRVSTTGGGAGTFSDELRITGFGTGDGSGNRNNRDVTWTYTASGTATTTYNGNNVPAVVPAPSGGNNIGTGYSTVRVNLPAGTVQAALQLVLVNNNAEETWAIDNVVLGANPGNTLPVELTSFTAAAQAGGNLLKWATASEKDNDHFDIQRSRDGGEFQTIGTVKGAGSSSSQLSYTFLDKAPAAGAQYYRLRQVDLDGTATLSAVVLVKTAKAPEVGYPNPSQGIIRLPAGTEPLQWRLLTLQGRSLRHGTASAEAPIELKTVPAGTYLLELTQGGQRTVQKIIHQN
ncbi:T9SS type A sorting domain-containing protein [Hymenobacter busanensis]|nr:T9SS type A sorting domain-containing protein [Hymenobacter busanensis]QHJ05856.1 T9SS type A sorting domain-containing protein [Hymenobacter busanensis]